VKGNPGRDNLEKKKEKKEMIRKKKKIEKGKHERSNKNIN
jgi:hypothetical protein